MKTSFHRFSPSCALAFALAALFAFAVPARAVRAMEVVSHSGNIAGYHANGTDYTISPSTLVDGSLVTGIILNEVGAYALMDFADDLDSDHLMYVGDMTIGHSGTGTYSLYWSDDGTTWNAIAESVQTTGSTVYPVNQRVKMLKYVAGTASNDKTLCEWEVKGFVSTKPKVVSSYAIASFHNANGTIETADFGGGDNWGANAGRRLFDGNFTTYWPQPRAQVGSFIMVDFTKNNGTSALKEYYVSKILVGSNGTMPFTLQYSETGTNAWKDVPGAVNVKYEGTGTFVVGAKAKYVRYVFRGVNWGYAMSQGYLAEIEVWGMDPNDIPCTHPSFTEWTEGIPASCTERALLTRSCTECGEVFTMYSDGLPLGHDYVTTLIRPGKFRHPGSGTITCSRCNFLLNFPEPIDLVTSRVDNVLICGRRTEGIIRFVDYDVSSENHPEWGPAALHLVDNAWTGEGSYPYWFSLGDTGQYADFMFGSEIDLTAVEFSVYNHGYLFQFFSLDEDTGSETLIGEQKVMKDNTAVGTKTVKQKTVDPETGEETEVEVEVEVAANYQRIRVPFYEKTIKNLRIRITDYEPTVNAGWGPAGIAVIEIHPWGTVSGAGEFHYRKETLMTLK